jgi:cytoskeletal protein RodZ
MNPFFEELRRTREAKKISLQHISDVTLINLSYLEAIEEGNTSILPQAYVRAFLREYAAVIGLNAEETMKRYDVALSAQTTAEEGATPTPAGPEPPEEPRARTLLARPTATKLIAGIVVVATIVILIIITGRPEQQVPVKEIPFQSAVQENESRIAASVADKQLPRTAPPSTAKDSLTLTANVTDSLWMQLVIDEQPPHEYLFSPSRRISWKAENRFLVTLGNAGAAQFTLGGKSLGTLGRKGAVVRNVEISRKNLATHQ